MRKPPVITRRLVKLPARVPAALNPLVPLARVWRSRAGKVAQPRRLNLALQGGGAHGAFTWGVLDALLEDPRLDFEALSGSSAGAINAVLMAQGWMQGGREGARQALSAFWLEVGKQIPWTMMGKGGDAISLSPAGKMLASWAGMFSPGSINPLGLNPLRGMLNAQIDFEGLRKRSPFTLFVGATQANTGMLRLFREHELTVDMLLASACLPKIHPTIEIEGAPYWDGGYAANPAVFPLVHETKSPDILLVLLTPHAHTDTPHSMEEIDDRIQELGFKTHFLREMQMFARTAALVAASRRPMGALERRLLELRFHMIDTNNLEVLQRSETKMLAHGPFLETLHDEGRAQARQWLEQHGECVGTRGTVDLAQWLV